MHLNQSQAKYAAQQIKFTRDHVTDRKPYQLQSRPLKTHNNELTEDDLGSLVVTKITRPCQAYERSLSASLTRRSVDRTMQLGSISLCNTLLNSSQELICVKSTQVEPQPEPDKIQQVLSTEQVEQLFATRAIDLGIKGKEKQLNQFVAGVRSKCVDRKLVLQSLSLGVASAKLIASWIISNKIQISRLDLR